MTTKSPRPWAKILGLTCALVPASAIMLGTLLVKVGTWSELDPGPWNILNNVAVLVAAGVAIALGYVAPRRPWLWGALAGLAAGIIFGIAIISSMYILEQHLPGKPVEIDFSGFIVYGTQGAVLMLAAALVGAAGKLVRNRFRTGD